MKRSEINRAIRESRVSVHLMPKKFLYSKMDRGFLFTTTQLKQKISSTVAREQWRCAFTRETPMEAQITQAMWGYYSDGIKCNAKTGEPVYITTGNSVRLDPFVNHSFGAKKGDGPLICGEVSKINDDHTDNYFVEPTSRFADIEEDEPALYPLCNEYDKFIAKK